VTGRESAVEVSELTHRSLNERIPRDQCQVDDQAFWNVLDRVTGGQTLCVSHLVITSLILTSLVLTFLTLTGERTPEGPHCRDGNRSGIERSSPATY
jgi:hypothetical protein